MRMKLMHPIKKIKAKKIRQMTEVNLQIQPGRKVGTTEQSDEKVVYLTLDDGPSKNTQAVLDILDKYNAKATFFVTGAMPEYKDIIKRLMIRDIRSECIHILMITQRCMHLLMHIFRILTRLDSL